MSKKLNEKLDSLVAENNERVKKVEELNTQIDQCKQAIQVLKEEHDFTRGQITLLTDMVEPASKKEE